MPTSWWSRLGERLPLILDAGDTGAMISSTIVDLRDNEWRIVREGLVAAEDIASAVGCRPATAQCLVPLNPSSTESLSWNVARKCGSRFSFVPQADHCGGG